ncbi:MAG TPA: thiamine diphosphokinase [Clostridia bacterium]|nr:thiamine diphosphokinase [Clostridia bacterium]
MRCLIFSGGDFHDPDWHRSQIREGDYLIGADRGAEHLLSMGFSPHLVVGDLDSLTIRSQEKLESSGVPIYRHPAGEEATDTELALGEAIKRSPEEIVILAGIGDRQDHSLANIHLLVGYIQSRIPITIATPAQIIWATDRNSLVKGFAGQTVSLLSLSPQVRGLTLEGFYYPLENAVLKMGSTLGISNILLADEGKIILEEGLLLVVQFHPSY